MNPNTEPTDQPVHNPLAAMQEGETVICDIKRHPIGIFGSYIVTGFILVIIAVVVYGVIPRLATNATQSNIYGFGSILFLFVAIGCLGFVYVANKVYWGNHWIVTSDSLTQVTQNSLFSKRSSQLSLANLEDVSAEQNGILAHMFNYGLLKVETAGEHSKFVLLFCPDPNAHAQKILMARENFVQHRKSATPASSAE